MTDNFFLNVWLPQSYRCRKFYYLINLHAIVGDIWNEQLLKIVGIHCNTVFKQINMLILNGGRNRATMMMMMKIN